MHVSLSSDRIARLLLEFCKDNVSHQQSVAIAGTLCFNVDDGDVCLMQLNLKSEKMSKEPTADSITSLHQVTTNYLTKNCKKNENGLESTRGIVVNSDRHLSSLRLDERKQNERVSTPRSSTPRSISSESCPNVDGSDAQPSKTENKTSSSKSDDREVGSSCQNPERASSRSSSEHSSLTNISDRNSVSKHSDDSNVIVLDSSDSEIDENIPQRSVDLPKLGATGPRMKHTPFSLKRKSPIGAHETEGAVANDLFKRNLPRVDLSRIKCEPFSPEYNLAENFSATVTSTSLVTCIKSEPTEKFPSCDSAQSIFVPPLGNIHVKEIIGGDEAFRKILENEQLSPDPNLIKTEQILESSSNLIMSHLPSDFPGLKCQSCPLTFTSDKQLELHQQTHREKRSCIQCAMVFYSKTKLDVHMRQHRGEDMTNLTCKYCHKVYARTSILNHHVRLVHLGVRPYKCDTCGKGFSSSTDLRVHEFRHTGERPHICKFCKKVFIRIQSLLMHIRTQHTHKGEKPFKCDLCGTAYTSKQGLKHHKKTAHMVQVFQCVKCKMKFEKQTKLRHHMMIKHMEAKHKCLKCGLKFSTESAVKQHTRIHKQVELLEAEMEESQLEAQNLLDSQILLEAQARLESQISSPARIPPSNSETNLGPKVPIDNDNSADNDHTIDNDHSIDNDHTIDNDHSIDNTIENDRTIDNDHPVDNNTVDNPRQGKVTDIVDID